MSSHHFVKEGQEPALFIVGALSLKLVEPLLEWSPFVLVLDTALDIVLSWGIKIDGVLVKKEQLEVTNTKVIEHTPIEIFSYEDGDEPLLIGIDYLKNNQKSVNITTHVNEDIFMLIQNTKDINVVLLEDKMKWSRFTRFEKWLPTDSQLSLIRTDPGQQFSVNGLSRLHENIFKSVMDGIVVVQSDAPFWLGEAIF